MVTVQFCNQEVFETSLVSEIQGPETAILEKLAGFWNPELDCWLSCMRIVLILQHFFKSSILACTVCTMPSGVWDPPVSSEVVTGLGHTKDCWAGAGAAARFLTTIL